MSDPNVTSSTSGPAHVPDRTGALAKKSGVKGAGDAQQGKEPPVARLVESDVLEISGPARQVARLREEIAGLPDVRAERIAEIKEKVKSGTYAVPTAEVAKKMIEWGRNHGGKPSGS